MPSKKRRYFKTDDSGKRYEFKIYLVRHQDSVEGTIQSDGPYKREVDAIDKLNSFLREGICSWLVTYHG